MKENLGNGSDYDDKDYDNNDDIKEYQWEQR
jgi:hypothetical protein